MVYPCFVRAVYVGEETGTIGFGAGEANVVDEVVVKSSGRGEDVVFGFMASSM